MEWTTGKSSELAKRSALNAPASAPALHAGHMHHTAISSGVPMEFNALDRMIANVSPLNLAYPVLISPPAPPNHLWVAASDSQNRTLRHKVFLDPATGAISGRQNFNQQIWVDRWIGIGVAAHEGQLFGMANKLLGLFTTSGLIAISISALVLWLRRRPKGVLGAPANVLRFRTTLPLILLIVVLGLYLPAFGLSLLFVLITERFFLRRWTSARVWLGL
jgi:uncharacterized iron-regulated membrane protein